MLRKRAVFRMLLENATKSGFRASGKSEGTEYVTFISHALFTTVRPVTVSK